MMDTESNPHHQMRSDMQETRTRDQEDKAKKTITSVTRSASCSHGWLRLVVQCIFSAITIVSFILIVYMSMTNRSQRASRCRLYTCRVVCNNAPFYSSNLNDIIYAVKEAELNCDQISLTLHEALFLNSTIPEYWLSNLRSNVNELDIIGGNLKYIAPNAFMTQFSAKIRKICFETVAIINWVPEALIGLTNLNEISIKSSYILGTNNNALEAVDDTLETLSITESGYWNPANFTGQSKLEALTTIYFSYNNFNNILQRNSFSGLQNCKVLYLNSCRISAIGEGTFDYFDKIEMLFLNNNFLVILPHNLFSKILSLTNPRPRINLQNNLWYCTCDSPDLEILSNSGVLILDPVCHYPSIVRDQTFSDFLRRCNGTTRSTISLGSILNSLDAVLFDGACSNDKGSSIMISSISIVSCSSTQEDIIRMSYLNSLNTSSVSEKPNKNEVLKARFAVQSNSLSMLEITSATAGSNYGLLWYQTACPDELYCVNTLPDYLRVFNVESDVEYTFCPINLETGIVVSEECLSHGLQTRIETTIAKSLRILSYILTTIVCTTIGASIVYTVIRKFPYLLKGSDRILFVKHKNVDALVLPPKVPLREKNVKGSEINNVIFTLSDNKAPRHYFVRTKSTRSNSSIAPSYISAMQPTEEQLTEWRLRQHFDNDVTITYAGINVPYSPLSDNESMYCSLEASSNN